MKKYFAKYLPVEGEIKEGDHFDSVNGELPGSLHTRLFLCSRDIQVGDMAKDLNQPLTDFYVDEKNLELIKKGNDDFYEHMNLYKVIGEISSEATWVKEGDEFDKEETKPVFKPKDVPKSQWKEYSVVGKNHISGQEKVVYPLSHTFGIRTWDIPVNPLTHIYQIKGPCGHFH